MGIAVVGFGRHLRLSRRSLALALCAALVAWALLRPWQFIGLWLTPDQQGWLLNRQGDYARAAQRFSDPRWRGMALYAAQDFAAAAQYFSQYRDAASLLARGNALAHQREYIPARAVYRELAERFPEHPAPAVNLPIVQRLIDANRELSESQAAEMGDLTSEQDEGPRSSEGDERQSMVPREQLSAAQLLEDPALTEMWLRQVQRNPSEFLATKFYMQLQDDSAAEESP
jgi:Ca-activated chloride channel family protein